MPKLAASLPIAGGEAASTGVESLGELPFMRHNAQSDNEPHGGLGSPKEEQ
jgi:hypothetical protein